MNEKILVPKVAHHSTAIVNGSGGNPRRGRGRNEVELSVGRARVSLRVPQITGPARGDTCRAGCGARNAYTDEPSAEGATGAGIGGVHNGEGTIRRTNKAARGLICIQEGTDNLAVGVYVAGTSSTISALAKDNSALCARAWRIEGGVGGRWGRRRVLPELLELQPEQQGEEEEEHRPEHGELWVKTR